MPTCRHVSMLTFASAFESCPPDRKKAKPPHSGGFVISDRAVELFERRSDEKAKTYRTLHLFWTPSHLRRKYVLPTLPTIALVTGGFFIGLRSTTLQRGRVTHLPYAYYMFGVCRLSKFFSMGETKSY